jgi:hypothetical protein
LVSAEGGVYYSHGACEKVSDFIKLSLGRVGSDYLYKACGVFLSAFGSSQAKRLVQKLSIERLRKNLHWLASLSILCATEATLASLGVIAGFIPAAII